MGHDDPLSYDSKIISELKCTCIALNVLETAAQAQRAHAQLVTIHAARDLAGYIEQLHLELRSAVGLGFLRINGNIKRARRQLSAWLARLTATLVESSAVQS